MLLCIYKQEGDDIMKQDIRDMYNSMLKQMVRTQEQMLDFMEAVEQIEEGHMYDLSTNEGKLKYDVMQMRTSVYDSIRHFLNDSNMTTTSSDIAEKIELLPDDEEDEDEE
jgi:hypothetical protein